MSIVFAENFQFDSQASIVTKYPGSTRAATANSDYWPMTTGNLFMTNLPESFDRIEFYMTFDGVGGTGTTEFPFFGLTLATPNATTLTINGNPQSAGSSFASI